MGDIGTCEHNMKMELKLGLCTLKNKNNFEIINSFFFIVRPRTLESTRVDQLDSADSR